MIAKPKEVSVREASGETSVEGFITQAISANVPVETLEKLFALREKVKAEAAKEAYIKSMSIFQSESKIIKKTRKVLNKDGSVRYTFAPLDSIVEQIQKPLAKAELSYRWETKQSDKGVTAICFVTHVLGHTESSDFTVEIDPSGFMTSPQKSASALTFAKRYSLCNALGISTGDEDDDATTVGKEKTAKSDKAKIMFLLKNLGHKADSKDQIAASVKKLTQLELVEENYEEIVTRLEVLVSEKQHAGTEIR